MSSWSDIRRYRATAARLRLMTRQMHFPENRIEALKIAEQFERLADYIERRLGPPARRECDPVPPRLLNKHRQAFGRVRGALGV